MGDSTYKHTHNHWLLYMQPCLVRYVESLQPQYSQHSGVFILLADAMVASHAPQRGRLKIEPTVRIKSEAARGRRKRSQNFRNKVKSLGSSLVAGVDRARGEGLTLACNPAG